MTPSEFKSWFDGFTEALTATPTKVQWARIKERVAEIDGKPVTQHVFVDRYYPAYPRQVWLNNYQSGLQSYGVMGLAQNQMYNLSDMNHGLNNASQSFNSSIAMLALGRVDAASLS